MQRLPFLNRLARTAEGHSRFTSLTPVKYKKPLLTGKQVDIINSVLARKAKLLVEFPEFGINRGQAHYTINRFLAGGEDF